MGISEPELSGSSEKDSKLAEQTFHRNKIIEAFAPLLRDTKERKAESDSSYYIAEYLNRKKLSASMVRNFMSIESNRGAAVEGDNILQKLADRLGIKQSELPQ